jgi:O-antigen/teichoic acid export membrane protein
VVSSGRADPTSSQIRGSSLLLAGQAFAVVANLAVQIFIVRYLTQEDYGAFAYALSIVMVAEAVAGFGMRRGVARYMPLYEESGDRARATGTLLLAIGTVLGISLSVVLIVAGFRGAFAGSFEGDTTAVTVLVILILLAPIQAFGTLLDGVFAVYARPRAIAARKFVLTPILRLAVVGLMVLGDQGVTFLAGAYVVTGALGLVLYMPLLLGTLREHHLLENIRERTYTLPVREIFRYTTPLLSNDVTSAVLVSGSAVALGVLATPTDVAELRAVLPLALTMAYVLSSFGLLLIPLATRLYTKPEEQEELNRLYWRTAVWTGVLAFPIFLTCVALPEPLTVLLFGERYADAAPVLAALAAGQFVSTAAGHNGAMLAVFGRVKFLTATNIAAIVIGLVLLVVLAPSDGALGAAVATSATFILLNVARQAGLGRLTSVRSMDPVAIPSYAAMAAVTAVVVGLELAFSPSDAIGIALIAAGVAVVFAVARSGLALGETFPQLAGIPVIGRLVGGGR